MPEGPEVRKQAALLDTTLAGRRLIEVRARTRAARAWLAERSGELDGRIVERVRSHGKHFIGSIAGGYYFHTHLMMWGRWRVVPPDDPLVVTPDRRERARLATTEAVAILSSAPIFDIGRGDVRQSIPFLDSLGPDILPWPEGAPFDVNEFLRRLHAAAERGVEIGAALLDQTIVAGIGNYLRAEILFECAIDPWRRVVDLTGDEMECLCAAIPTIARRAMETGRTVTDETHQRLLSEPGHVYTPGRTFGSRYHVFRRTNLPCVRCGDTIRQARQETTPGDEDRPASTRITYFCPTCQRVARELPPPRPRKTRR